MQSLEYASTSIALQESYERASEFNAKDCEFESRRGAFLEMHLT